MCYAQVSVGVLQCMKLCLNVSYKLFLDNLLAFQTQSFKTLYINIYMKYILIKTQVSVLHNSKDDGYDIR